MNKKLYVSLLGFIMFFTSSHVEAKMTKEAHEYTLRKKGSYKKLIDIQKYLHSCCIDMISNRYPQQPIPTTFISFPIYGAKASNLPEKYKVGNSESPLQGIGACFIYFEKNAKPSERFRFTIQRMGNEEFKKEMENNTINILQLLV